MYSWNEVFFDSDGESEAHRWLFTPSAVLAIEKTNLLGQLYMRWAGACTGEEPPLASAFDGDGILADCQSDRVMLIDVDPRPDIDDFFVKMHLASGWLDSQLVFGRLGPRAEHFHRRCFRNDIMECVRDRTAHYYWVLQVIAGTREFFSRLCLPLIDARGKVTEVLLAASPTLDAPTQKREGGRPQLVVSNDAGH